ncbi:MAG: PorV/PorQ family protein, partial [bacterium]
MRNTVSIAAILALGCLGLLAGVAQADQGSTGAAFLQLDTSPRVIGMGDSFTGLADDVSDIEYNPAGSAYLTQKELTLMDASWIQGISYDYGAVAWPFSFGTLSADFFYLNAGSFQGTALTGGGTGYVDTGTFTAGSMYGTVAYARKILPYLSLGLNLKFLNETIAEYAASDISAGLSAFYRSPIPGLTAGFSISNLGPSESFSGVTGTGATASPLPANFRLGVGYKPTADISVDSDYVQYFNT